MKIPSASLPSRERGLKLDEFQSETGDYWSLPSRERGLKSVFGLDAPTAITVAPFAGAWIEIVSTT